MAGHICALVHDADDWYASLGPFIAEGLDAGDRELHLVGDREAHLARLQGLGIEVDAALAAGQLQIFTWAESYLRGGGFSRLAMLEWLRQQLDAGRRRRVARTRIVATMEWALERTEWAPELGPYEDALTRMLRARPDVVVCAYELERHGAPVITAVRDFHPLALSEGVLRASRSLARVAPRERILAAADDYFHTFGIRATGVDTLIEAAGVAKATFYRHFPSKDDLVVAWLRDERPRWLYRVRATVESFGRSPSEQLPLFYEETARWLESDGYGGCCFHAAALEITETTHPAWPVIRGYLDEIEGYLRELLLAARHPAARELAPSLAVLLSGALVLGVARRSGAPVLIARDAAMSLVAV
jgi:AcrR family transcriptional regulator